MDLTAIIIILLIVIIICFIISPWVGEKTKYKSVIETPINQTFYWINLEKCVDRRENMINMFNEHDIKNVRIDAILGGPTDHDKDVACTKSHIKAIQTFLKSGDEVGVICEDDLTMEYKKYWRCDLDEVIAKAPKDWEVIQLSIIVHPLVYHLIINSATTNYIRYHPWVCGALCYIINRKGAEKLTQPVTPMAEHYVFGNLKAYTFKYPMFTYPYDNDSTIHPTHLSSQMKSKKLITNYLKYN